MKVLHLTNCLIGGANGQDITIYAPKASACITLPKGYLAMLLFLGLREKQMSKNATLKTLTSTIGAKEEAVEVIESLLEYGVLVEQETPPRWNQIPSPLTKKPVDILLVVVNYPYAGDVNTPMPFGAMVVATALREAGFEVAILDMALKRLEPWKIVPFLRRYNPRIVGLSAITAAGKEAERVSQWIKRWAKRENPDFKGIILGGHHATDFTAAALNSRCFNIVLAGKLGFLSAPSAFRALLKGRVQDIPGVNWQLGQKSIYGKLLGWQPEAQIPTPAWDLVEQEKYSAPGADFLGMGCPFSCVYCTVGGVPKIYRPLKEVKEELLKAMRKGCYNLALMDDEIFHNQEKTKELVEMFERDTSFRKANLYLQSRIDSTESRYRDGLLKRLYKAVNGLYVEIGVDGLTQKDIDNVRKGRKITVKSPFRIMNIAGQIGCKIGFGSIFGFPWDTKEDLKDQSNYIQSLLDYANRQAVDLTVMSGVFTPFPGSALGRKVVKGELEGTRVVNLNPEWFDFHRPNVDTPFWSHQYLEQFMVQHFQKVM